MDLTVANVYGLLIRSKLMPIDEARAMFAAWQSQATGQADNVARFAAWMVEKGYLTDYQAGLLARGHGEGFFLNEYKILDRLGKGRMAGVYKARHHLGQVVALKVLPPSKARDAQLFGRFQREARLALKLQHANIVRAFEVGKAGELHYLVLEYLEGETLEEVLLKRGRLQPGEAVHLVYQALQGLQHIHERGVVHRDLKPSNLMIVPAPDAPNDLLRATVKILDIGLGRSLMDDSAAAAFDAGLTGEGVVLGTPDYMAPEQARDAHAIDIRADIYSLGCVLYHLLAGQPPFPDTNMISQMIRHATEPLRPVTEIDPQIPGGLQQILNWMLAKDPAGRYPTPERAGQALQVFLVAGDVKPVGVEADPKMRSYLTWLERNQTPEPARQPAAVVATTPMLDVAAARPVEAEEPARRKKRDSGRPKVPPPLPANEAPAPTPVPAPTLMPTRLTKRDLIVFVVGVVCGALAMLVGCVLALRGR